MFSRLLSTAKNIFTKPETSNSDRIPDSTGRRSPKKRGTPRATPKVVPRGSPRSSRASSPTKKLPGRSKLSQTTTTTCNPATGRKEVKMVTTRRQSGALFGASKDTSAATSDNEINEDEIAYELLTQSAQKRRREKAREAGEETPSKRRKLPVRTKGDKKKGEVEVHSHLAVEIPLNVVESDGGVTNHGFSNVAAKLSAASSKESTPGGTPTQRKRGRPSKKEAEAQKAHEENMRKVNELNEILTAAKDRESTESEDEEETPKPEPSKVQKQAAKLSPPVAETPVEEEQKELAPPPKPKHKKFGDDDVAEPIPLPEPLVEVIEEMGDSESGSEEDDSDDDAPEEVGGKAAQKKAQEVVRSAAKAAEQKEVAERQKRQERDAELKKQAKAAKKRRHAEEAAEEAALAAAEEEQDGDESMTLQDDNSSPVPEEAQPSKKIKFDRFNLPAELPEDFLEDKGSDDEMMDFEEERGHKSKKIKFVEEKKVKDLRLGHTTFRVQKQKRTGLAPKANARAKALKEALMGKRKGQAEFRKAPTGFFGGRK